MSQIIVSRVRVRYAETDTMGVLHHAVWPVYWELGRTELLRAVYRPYAEIEREGILFPLVDYGVKMDAAARYDDAIEIRTRLTELGRVRLRFDYEGWRGDERLATGHTVHGVIDRDWRVRRLPAELAAALRKALTPAEVSA
jgi:acyl-CoA thioester hydrolase